MFYDVASPIVQLASGILPTLLQIDLAFATMIWSLRCQHCRGALHQAHYPRKPRGADEAASHPENLQRFSFCCGTEGCRHRATPFSLRFLGRKVYFGAVVLLVSALRHGRKPWTASKLSALFGPDEDTIWRWAQFWREQVVGSPFWRRQVEGSPAFFAWVRRWGTRRFEDLVPWSWLEALGLPITAEKLTRCLELCAPLTSSSAPGSLAV